MDYIKFEEIYRGEQFHMSKDMSVVKAEEVQSFHPEPGMLRQVLAHNQHLMLVRHFFEKGWVGARQAIRMSNWFMWCTADPRGCGRQNLRGR